MLATGFLTAKGDALKDTAQVPSRLVRNKGNAHQTQTLKDVIRFDEPVHGMPRRRHRVLVARVRQGKGERRGDQGDGGGTGAH